MKQILKIASFVLLVPYIFYGLIFLTGQTGLTDATLTFSWPEFIAAPIWVSLFFSLHFLAFIGGGPNNFPILFALFILSLYLAGTAYWLFARFSAKRK